MTSETRTVFRPAHSRSAADADQQKENHDPAFRGYRHNSPPESSDDGDFDLYLAKMATPKGKAKSKSTSQTPHRTARNNSSRVVVVSSEDDDCFENFLDRMKTPKTKKTPAVASEDSLNHFIVDAFSSDDDFIQKKPLRVPKNSRTPVSRACVRTPLAPHDSVFLSDDNSSDDDNGVVVTSTWRTRHKKLLAPTKTHKPSDALPSSLLTSDEEEGSQSPLVFQFPRPALPPPPPAAAAPAAPRLPTTTTTTQFATPARIHSAPTTFDDSSTSEEEFASLLERLKKKNGVVGGDWPAATHGTDNRLKTPVSKGLKAPVSKSVEHASVDLRTPVKTTKPKPPISQTEPRQGPQSRVQVCKTPGCFLQSLSIPARNFKQTKEGLTSRLYQLYNTSVFDGKLPTDMSVTWNKKMRKTAGYCISGQERGGGKRYARIELSEKVCDTADRLRDTLVHEMCHAATWLINGVRDGHGSFWKLYARKATLAHPELPVVTRCHSYDITYKFQYQCTRCKNTIGRHSKSLDTQKFVCALCTGPLVLLTPVNARAPTPFANFVKENYGNVRQELVGKSHADVMRKLSTDFATKTKLGQS